MHTLRLFSLVSLWLMATLAYALPAAHVVSASGTVSAEDRSGSSRTLKVGGELNEGDTLITGADGRLQIKTADHGIISLRGNSRFSIDEFAYEPAAGRERAFFSLIKGGFRNITGAIGKERHDDYRVTTPVATLGVRGTDYGAVLCTSACGSGGFQPGLYVRVSQDTILITAAGASLIVSAGQVAFVAGPGAAPVLLDSLPPESFWTDAGTSTSLTAGITSPGALPALIAIPAVALPIGIAAGDSGNNSDDDNSPE